MPRRTAVIIGAMKAGTTTLHHLLAQHPEICSGHRKELKFFLREKKFGRRAYRQEFPGFDRNQHSYQLDSSPQYTKQPKKMGVPERMLAHDGNLKIIYILREPVARIRSHIYHNIKQSRWTPNSIDHAKINYCISVSRYHKQIEAYDRVGLANDMLLLDFQRIVEDPVSVSHSVFDFLGIEKFTPKDLRARNVNKISKKDDCEFDLSRCSSALADEGDILYSRYGFRPLTNWT